MIHILSLCEQSLTLFLRSLRVQQQNKTAEAMAKVLMKHPLVEKVHAQQK
jgi:hypothetical protein